MGFSRKIYDFKSKLLEKLTHFYDSSGHSISLDIRRNRWIVKIIWLVLLLQKWLQIICRAVFQAVRYMTRMKSDSTSVNFWPFFDPNLTQSKVFRSLNALPPLSPYHHHAHHHPAPVYHPDVKHELNPSMPVHASSSGSSSPTGSGGSGSGSGSGGSPPSSSHTSPNGISMTQINDSPRYFTFLGNILGVWLL